MAHIGHDYHYDDVFVRMVTIGLLKVFGTKVRWINRYTDKKIRVLLPFYASMAGQERFLLDAFVDDIPDKRVELNTDQKQRGMVVFKGGTTRDEEFTNPNQYLSKTVKINDETRTIMSRSKAVPVSLNYDFEIHLDNELEVEICWEKIVTVIWNYRFYAFDYFGIKLDAFFKLPPDMGIDIPREINLQSDNTPTIKFSLEVQTCFPIFNVNTDDCEVCDNDDQIDWEFLGVPRPTLEGTDNCKGIKRVYWYNNLLDSRSKEEIIKEKERDKNIDSDKIE